eukprot:CAMPEP_0172303942 /NCGR_PEP_ID=MMETSP1058-20130122/5427_1 /TAXON_ID=83371 /ORGANISM="Detonula confervacea, Strain CCMP 353" /LENGTH=227 /DNA_ID=CAMNT_0013014979 /DNA_START=88 /DNA_END=771 /DNA_ORIENTATION=+
MAKKNKKNQPKPKQKLNNGGATAAAPGTKRKREVQVVVCPSAFPDFTTVGGSTSRRQEQQRLVKFGGNKKYDAKKEADDEELGPELDVQETIREVHAFGAEGFTGVQKKSHQSAEYKKLTGRTAKRQKMPTKIVVGMRQKAMKREERQQQELKESGVVSHHSQGKKKVRSNRKKEEEPGGGLNGIFGSNRARNTGDRRNMNSTRSFGPAPDVGFMQKGMLKVKQSRR